MKILIRILSTVFLLFLSNSTCAIHEHIETIGHHVIEADQLLHEQTLSEDEISKQYKKGYLVGEEITEHKNTKRVQDLCSFHKAETLLNQQLQSASLREVFDIDRENGSLFDRLSTVRF